MKELYTALAKAQGELENPKFDKTNPHFKSRFASLASVRDTVAPVLAKHGLAVTQTYEAANDVVYLVTTLAHESGLAVRSTVPLPPSQNAQQMGSATTYLRRYSLMAILNVVGDEDDDGNEASKPRPGVHPYPDGTDSQDPELVEQYADGIRTHLNVENEDGVWGLHLELNKDQPLYAAVGRKLNTKEKARLKEIVEARNKKLREGK